MEQHTKTGIIGLIGVVLMLGCVFIYLKLSTNTNLIADYAIAGIILSSGLQTMAMSIKSKGGS